MPNYPTPPSASSIQSNSFPADLMHEGRKFYTDISIVQYDYVQQFGSLPTMNIQGNIQLPLPRRINDSSFHSWSEISATSMMQGMLMNSSGSQMLGAAGQMFSVYKGKQLNPWMFMMYQRPGYKEHDLNWMLTASNKDESDKLNKIINQLKKAALPSASGGSLGNFVWDYPQIAMISLKPDKYLFKFQPCAILGVSVDHTAAGNPSFFKSGAATTISLSLKLKEIALWTKDNYRE